MGMDIGAAQNILSGLTEEQRNVLESAHWRYMAFVGIVQEDSYQKQAEDDQKTYPHLLKFDGEGRPMVSDERSADFMVAVTGLPREWCLAWDEHDFFDMHGVTTEEAAKAGHV